MHTAATALAAITVRHRNTGDDSRGGIVTSIYPRFYDCRVGRRRFGRALLDFHGKPRALGTLRCAWYNCTERCDHSGPRILVSQPPTGAATRGALCTCVNPRFASSHSVSLSLAVALTRGPLATRGSLSRSISLSLSLSVYRVSAPLRPRDPTRRRWLRISLPLPAQPFLCPRHALSLSLSVL